MKEITIAFIHLYHSKLKSYRLEKRNCSGSFILKFALGTLLTLSLFYLPACSKEEPIKIGFIGGLTGRVADLGTSGRNAAILAVEERNSRGGVNGRQILLITVDDKQDKEVATKAFNSLLSQGVVAVIGNMTSSMSVATVPLANKNHIILMSPTSTSTHLKNIDDYFFRVCATTDNYGMKMARYFHNVKGLKKVTVIYDLGNKVYTESWVNHFIDEFTNLGGEIVRKLTFTSGPGTHFTDVAQQALQTDTEGIVISSSTVDAAMLSQQIRKLNDSVVIGTSEWAATEKLIELGGTSVENIIVSQFFDRDSTNPLYKEFKENFKTRFGKDPGFPSVGSYDATNVILDALERQIGSQDLKQTILAVSVFDGIQGKITINKFGDSDRPTYLSEIQNGKFVKVETQ